MRITAARGLWVVAVGVWIALGVMAVTRVDRPTGDVSPATSPNIVVGIPGGTVFQTLAPSASATPEPATSSTVPPIASQTPAPIPVPSIPVPTAQPTSAPVAAATAVPAAAAGSTRQPAVASVSSPTESVRVFYGHVAAAEFNEAYALWSDRMKATYPRAGNLDDRFAATAGIAFDQLFVAEASGQTATVQANFTETYDSGASRDFIGYWRLVLVDNRWLLDEPHY